MLTHLTVEHFKSLEKVSLEFGALNFFVGTNASGKSNLLDALRVLQGVGYGFTIQEIFDGKSKTTSSSEWGGIRGGSERVLLKLAPTLPKPSKPATKNSVRFVVEARSDKHLFNYEIRLNPLKGAIRLENLRVNHDKIFGTELTPLTQPHIKTQVYGMKPKQRTSLSFSREGPILHQLLQSAECPRERREALDEFIDILGNVQHLELAPSILRSYSQRQTAERLGEHGEDFAALVRTILSDSTTGSEYTSWLQELTPTEVEEVTILKGAVNEPLFALREGKNIFPAPVLSDGTLRFAALAAALFQPNMPYSIFIEEIENGIHPTRLRLLVELLRSQSASSRPQIFATTHSPLALAWLKAEEYRTTFLFSRDARGITKVRSLSEIPRLQESIKQTPINDLFAEGWLESAL